MKYTQRETDMDFIGTEKYWNRTELFEVPEYRDATELKDAAVPGQRAILYKGMTFDGCRNDVFAYIGYPSTPMPKDGYPGVVMVHGGCGTAYHTFASYFNSLGYATIAMDLYNCYPAAIDPNDNVTRGKLPGQEFTDFGGCVEQGKQVIKSIGNAVLAHTLFRSLPNIDISRIGMVGISWGSVFSSVISAIDERIKIIIPVYGHGFNGAGDGSNWFYCMTGAPWDPGRYLHAAKSPLHWIGGTNDAAFSMLSMQKSYDAAPTTVNYSYLPELVHGHCGYKFPIVARIFQHALCDGKPLPHLGKSVIDGDQITAPVLCAGNGVLQHAVLNYTLDDCPCISRKWLEAEAVCDGKSVSATIPAGATAIFLNLYDQQESDGTWNCCGSSNALFIKPVIPGSAFDKDAIPKNLQPYAGEEY